VGDSIKKKTYSKEFKLNAIRMYLSGQYGGYTPVANMLEICKCVNLGTAVYRTVRTVV